MRTKEFIKKIEDLGFNIEEDSDTYFPEYDSYQIFLDCNLVAVVFKKFMYSFDTAKTSFDELGDKLKTTLYHLIRSYAETPIEEREEEKKFYLEHIWMNRDWDFCYLNFNNDTKSYALSTIEENKFYKTQFNLKEIKKIKEKYNTDLSDFDMVEVEE